MENPSDKSFIREVAAALLWPVAAIAVEVWNCIHIDLLGHAHGKRARSGNASDHSPWRAGAISIVGIVGL
jgi:hypothetical protein